MKWQLLLVPALVSGLKDEGFLFNLPPGNSIGRNFTLNLTHVYHSPGGIYRSGFLINGQSPGPLLEADEDDWVSVTINNFLPVSLTIHFHGVLQKGTPWFDGVPGVSQYPILSGESYTHHFQVKDQWGPAWYHAHHRGYSSDGLYGPMYFRPKSSRLRPYHLVTNNTLELELIRSSEVSPVSIMADDLFDVPMDDIISKMHHFGIDPVCIQAILINGKGRVYCPDFVGISRKFTDDLDSYGCIKDGMTNGFADLRETMDNNKMQNPGYMRHCEPTASELFSLHTENRDWQYLNVINAGGQYTKSFSIDDHILNIVAVDGVSIVPKAVHKIQIPVGSRISILLRTIPSEHENPLIPFKMRFAAVRCPQYIEGVSLLRYGRVAGEKQCESCSRQFSDNGLKFQDLHGRTLGNATSIEIHELLPLTPSLKHIGPAHHTFKLYMNRTGVIDFSMFKNGAELPLHYEMKEPFLFQSHKSISTYTNFSAALSDYEIRQGDVIDVVLDNYRKYNHPVHLHGHLFHLVSFSSVINFQYSTVQDAIADHSVYLNLANPPHYDSTLVPPGGHAVVRFIADNPGVWMIHCHNLNHLLGGMGAIFFETMNEIPTIPPYLLQQPHAEYEQIHSTSDRDKDLHDHSLGA